VQKKDMVLGYRFEGKRFESTSKVSSVSQDRLYPLPGTHDVVRKIGARICQDRNNGYTYVSYVESVADEKVQIRVSEANVSRMSNYPLKGFSPSIIWDAPMNWDLCE
jgi:hypothetical protein